MLEIATVFWKDGIRFAYPGVFTFLTVSVYSSILTPTLYSTSNYGPTRLLNLQYFMMYPLIVANVLYWTGWVASRRKKVSEKHFEDLAYKPLIVIAFVACFGLSILHWGIWNTWSSSAISSLRNGEASRYRTEQYARLSVLEDQTVSDPVFEPFTSKPRIFFGEELTSDPEFFSNRLCASYYGKNSVRVET